MRERKAPLKSPRELYDDSFIRAMQFAERHLERDQALEIAHSVASEMLAIPADRVTPGLIYVAVTSRLRNFWRARVRRASAESTYHEIWSSVAPMWSEPGAQLEWDELQVRIEAVIADMPTAMRAVFVLIRDEELSYKEAAERLGVTPSTIHTQISRASARLRECIAQYQADAPKTRQSRRNNSQ